MRLVLELTGLASLVVAAALVAVPLALVVAGAECLWVALQLSRGEQ